MNDIAISVKNLSKKYRLYDSPQYRLREALHPFRKKYHREFWALRNISFEVKKGDSIGIIGKNGCGKSTLLQILCSVLQATEGEVVVNGKISALLELGAGFNPEFTGRQNVYMNGALLGYTKEEMDGRLKEIVDFADIGDFIEQPVKTYSSGMYVRLAFACAINVKPDILVVDEALSVGDVFFQQKCFSAIREILSAGTTLLFVSHDLVAMQNICNRALLLNRGILEFEGLSNETTARYYAGPSQKMAVSVQTHVGKSARPFKEDEERLNEIKKEILTHNILPSAKSRYGMKRFEVIAAAFVNEHNLPITEVSQNQTATILFLLRANQPIKRASFGIHLYDRMNELIFAAGARNLSIPLRDMEAGQEMVTSYKLILSVAAGSYTISIGCSAEPDEHEENPGVGVVDDRHEGIGPILVKDDASKLAPFYGKARLDVTIEYL